MSTAKLFARAVVAVCSIGLVTPAFGQDQQAAADLAKQAQNPIASMISLPFQDNINFGVGPNDRTQNTFNVQPVIPFSLGRVNLITRTIIPILYRPDLTATTGATSGLGDINASFMFSPARAGRITWGIGPIVYFPTATDENLGSNRWSIGPSFVALAMPGNWVIGGLVNNAWSVGGGDEDDADVNSFLLQYFVNYNLPNQWYLTSAPIITANWEAPEGEKWVVPVGGGFGKIFSVGGQPLNGQVQAFWFAKHPSPELIGGRPPGGLPPDASDGGSWQLRLQLQMLFPR